MTANPMQNGRNVVGKAGADIKGSYRLRNAIAGRTGARRARMPNATASMAKSVRYTKR